MRDDSLIASHHKSKAFFIIFKTEKIHRDDLFSTGSSLKKMREKIRKKCSIKEEIFSAKILLHSIFSNIFERLCVDCIFEAQI